MSRRWPGPRRVRIPGINNTFAPVGIAAARVATAAQRGSIRTTMVAKIQTTAGEHE